MSVIWAEPEVTDDLTTNEGKCKSDHCHNFLDDTPVLSFCSCQRWQVIEVISPVEIECLDINGERMIFGRD